MIRILKIGILAAAFLQVTNAHAADSKGAEHQLEQLVNETVRPVMKENGLPGMAVAITVDGKRFFFGYGVASKESGRKVTENTIFEIGSVSKTFAATLAAYAVESGTFSLSEKASTYLPALDGGALGKTDVLDLGTYTAGGLPLQVPDDVTNQDGMIAYFRAWKPEFPAGTHRRYSNPSIGLFGYLAAESMGKPFDVLMEEKLLPALGLSNTFIHVPKARMGDYAYGYSKAGKPVRVTSGVLDSQAYGIKTTAPDLIRFVESNMSGAVSDEKLRAAIAGTHLGYYKVGGMTQGLGWESYSYPTTLDRLLTGNSADMAFKPQKAEKLNPPVPAAADAWLNKTGSTNGFGAYAAFIPARKVGIAILANKNYPIPVRIKAAYRILSGIEKLPGL
ncbi:class C beta-lactamase [Mesorhizobium sp. NPDC059054]|uniref:class C beta-lactamase n=1 Tax=Mesorhizobium sp. NPDC059054 TaxID=3346711 RepID=UPI0036CC42B8